MSLSDRPATISIENQPQQPVRQVPSTSYWYRLERLCHGTMHRFTLFSGGQPLGTDDVAAYTELSQPLPGARQGTLSEVRTVTSRISGGAVAAAYP